MPEGQNVSKLPLNDTVNKTDPDAFINKIREAVMKYDLRMNNREIEEKPSSLEDEKEYFRPTKFNRVVNVLNSPVNQMDESDSKKKSSNSNSISPPVSSPQNSKPAPSPSNSNRSSPNNRRFKNNDFEFDIKHDELNSSEEILDSAEALKTGQNENERLISSSPLSSPIQNFTQSNRSNQLSPSPILSLTSSPEPTIVQENSKSLLPKSPTNASRIDSPTKNNSLNKSKDSNNKSMDKKPVNKSLDDTKSSNSSSSRPASEMNEKILVEKDGKFKLMSPEEYTAYEEQLKIENQIAEEKENKSPEETIEEIKQEETQKPPPHPNSTKLISSNLVPHPPTRPKTSIYSNGRNSLKTRFILTENSNTDAEKTIANSNSSNITGSTTNSSNTNSMPSAQEISEQRPKRISQSAEPNGRRSLINKG